MAQPTKGRKAPSGPFMASGMEVPCRREGHPVDQVHIRDPFRQLADRVTIRPLSEAAQQFWVGVESVRLTSSGPGAIGGLQFPDIHSSVEVLSGWPCGRGNPGFSRAWMAYGCRID